MNTDQFFVELFEYSRNMNQLIIDASLNTTEKSLSKTSKLFSHILNAHHIWNTRIQGVSTDIGVWQIQEVETWSTIDEMNFDDSINLIKSGNLDSKISYKNSKGQSFENSIHDILFHVINHSNYHRAQIAVDFRENGMQPISTDYIFQKRK